MRTGWLCDLRQMPYAEAFTLQKSIHHAQVEGRVGEGLLLVEHPPVITVGRRSRQDHLLTPRDRLESLGVEVAHTDRGGQITYHGPGQIVAYPLVDLTTAGLSLHGYVRGLEQAVIDTLERFGIASGRIRDLTGVWVGNEKICAIGLRIRRWWTLHGLALNVAPNLEHFGLFVPCGITERGVTSMQRVLHRDLSLEEVKPALAEELSRTLGCAWAETLSLDTLRRRIQATSGPARPPLSKPDAVPERNDDPQPSIQETESDESDLDPDRLTSIPAETWPRLEARYYPEIDSTNDEARRLLSQGLRPPFLVVADYQQTGRGRRGTPWKAPRGTSLLLTLVLSWQDVSESQSASATASHTAPPRAPGEYSLLAAWAVARGLEEFSPRKPMIKWPNDVLIGGRKVCGILVERAESSGESREESPTARPDPVLLIGIGINVSQSEEQLPTPQDSPDGIGATSLRLELARGHLAAPLHRADVLKRVLHHFHALVEQPLQSVRKELIVRCSTLGRGVRIEREGQEPLTGLAIGLDNDGALRVQVRGDRIERILSGRVRELPTV